MPYAFQVTVPVEAVVHEGIESSSTGQLPAGTYGRFVVRKDGDLSTVAIDCQASSPGEAMRLAISQVEDLLRVLAAANDSYRTRPSGARAEIKGGQDAGNTLFATGHLATTKLKGSLSKEAEDVDANEVTAWWATRGGTAHGETGEVDDTSLSRLMSRTQAAQAKELGAVARSPGQGSSIDS
jgi:hypothetical protein